MEPKDLTFDTKLEVINRLPLIKLLNLSLQNSKILNYVINSPKLKNLKDKVLEKYPSKNNKEIIEIILEWYLKYTEKVSGIISSEIHDRAHIEGYDDPDYEPVYRIFYNNYPDINFDNNSFQIKHSLDFADEDTGDVEIEDFDNEQIAWEFEYLFLYFLPKYKVVKIDHREEIYE